MKHGRRILNLVLASAAVAVIYLAMWWFFVSSHRVDRVTRTFPAGGISKVVIRGGVPSKVTADPEATSIEISGTPVGGAKGYHSGDPSWRETPPEKWGLDFVSELHGDVLVVSTKNEVDYMHHYYSLQDLRIRVPPKVEIVCYAAMMLAGKIGVWRTFSERVDPVTRTFPADGVSKVVIRAAWAESASRTADPKVTSIEIIGTPVGGSKDYHPGDPSWCETPPEKWGLDFVSALHGDVLVVSTKNEMEDIHHHYSLLDLRMRVPGNVEIVRQATTRAEKSDPDLSPP